MTIDEFINYCNAQNVDTNGVNGYLKIKNKYKHIHHFPFIIDSICYKDNNNNYYFYNINNDCYFTSDFINYYELHNKPDQEILIVHNDIYNIDHVIELIKLGEINKSELSKVLDEIIEKYYTEFIINHINRNDILNMILTEMLVGTKNIYYNYLLGRWDLSIYEYDNFAIKYRNSSSYIYF